MERKAAAGVVLVGGRRARRGGATSRALTHALPDRRRSLIDCTTISDANCLSTPVTRQRARESFGKPRLKSSQRPRPQIRRRPAANTTSGPVSFPNRLLPLPEHLRATIRREGPCRPPPREGRRTRPGW